MISSAQFMETVESMIGTPIAQRGRSRRGVDCAGLIIVACAENGIVLPDTMYGLWPSGGKLTSMLNQVAVKTETMVSGALLQVFKGQGDRHLGVFAGLSRFGQPLMIHAWGEEGCVKKAILADRLSAVWLLKGITY